MKAEYIGPRFLVLAQHRRTVMDMIPGRALPLTIAAAVACGLLLWTGLFALLI